MLVSIETREDGSRTKHFRDSTGHEHWITYDAEGRKTHYRDSTGHEHWITYDAEGRETHYRDSTGYSKHIEKDTRGRGEWIVTRQPYTPEAWDDA